MLKVDLGKKAKKYLNTLQKKHHQQIVVKIFELSKDPEPNDSKKVIGSLFRRADIGEHRIIYSYDEKFLFIPLIGKRNDGDVYRRLNRYEH